MQQSGEVELGPVAARLQASTCSLGTCCLGLDLLFGHLQFGPGPAVWGWTCSLGLGLRFGLGPAVWAWACSLGLDLQFGFGPAVWDWTCSLGLDMQFGLKQEIPWSLPTIQCDCVCMVVL